MRRRAGEAQGAITAFVNPQARANVPDLGYRKRMTRENAHRVLGWTAPDPEDAIVAVGQ